MPDEREPWGVTSFLTMFFRGLILRIAALGFVKNLVTKGKPFKSLVQRFIAGETLDEAVAAAEALAERGLHSTLDLLGENVSTKEEAAASIAVYEEIIERVAASKHREKFSVSLKLTALGFDLGDDVAEENYRKILAKAAPYGIPICADMESSAYTEKTIQLLERVFPDYPNAGTVVQSMLRRTHDDIERLIKLGCRVRLVKGAYLEPSEVAFQEKKEVDLAFVDGARRLLSVPVQHAIATHDEEIVKQVNAHIVETGKAKGSFEYQMLYGIRRDLQESLAADGHLVRVYIPYGSEWYPYFSRRLAERPANLGFILKSLFRK